MRIVIAPDKFKDCLSAPRVAEAIAAGIRRAVPDALIDLCPMADGGEGTVEALVSATGGRLVTRTVTGPLPDMRVEATFGILGDASALNPLTAVIEMAQASGLHYLKPEQRNPLHTTTFGTGELIRAAIEMGAQRIILGIGGSATTDGGLGCAQACGARLVIDSPCQPQPFELRTCATGAHLPQLISLTPPSVAEVRIVVACDVTNPLYGPQGAAVVYGPQKGATPETVRRLDAALESLALKLDAVDLAQTPGAGAAGGLGFGLLAFFHAALRPGIEIVIDATRLRDRLRGADLCITGEGRIDASSLSGKTPVGVARACAELGVPCVALGGSVSLDGIDSLPPGLTAVLPICPRPMTLEEALRTAPANLAQAGEQVGRLYQRSPRSAICT